jgi:spermidine/putrescine transport system substrate-binding protein
MKTLQLSRRRLLQKASAMGLVSLAAPGLFRPARAAEGGLTVMDWTGYEVPDLFQPYVRKHGSAPDITIFSDLEEAWQKIAGGFRPDVMHADHWQIPARRDAGMFEPWDTSRLANFPALMPELVTLPTLQKDGAQYGIPVDWGINSICYRTDLIEVGEESWNSLWNPDYAGRMATTTQMDNLVGAAALTLGIENPFVNDPEVMKAIEARLVEQRSLLRFYWSDPTQLTQAMATGEVAIAFAWPSVYKELKAQGIPVKYMRPKEGVMGWAQGMLLMADRDGDTGKAYDFMDAWISAETGRWLIENYGYGHANLNSVDGVDPELLADLLLEDPLATLASSFFIRDMPSDVQTAYVAMVERIKAGG